MAPKNASLAGLPDELLLGILLHFSTIRSFETYSTTFDEREKEIARQRENRLRQISLSNLCLTSRHLNRLAIPALYAAFTGSSTWFGIGSLRRFHHEITAPRKDSTYASHLQYVENRNTDREGRNIFANLDDPSDLYMIKEYFSLLAGVINSAPNLQHINVTSTETSKVSFWKHVINEKYTVTSRFTLLAGHGLGRLKTLCIQTDFEEEEEDQEVRESFFDSICSAMASVPSLSDIRATGAMVKASIRPKVNFGQFRNLQRLEMTECLIDFRSMGMILSACEGLRHIVCSWNYLDCLEQTIADFRPGLLKHSHTLETLFLDFRKVRHDTGVSIEDPGRIASLGQFENLHTLTISRMHFLVGLENSPSEHWPMTPSKVAEMLPLSLKRLNLFVELIDGEDGFPEMLGDQKDLWDLLEACKASLPNLSEITVVGSSEIYGQGQLMYAFEQAGVCFEVITEH
ncbi:hypothetical protein GGP41_007402 [Bipolaris sorokiniana]|uniref:Uncharacterized protein n=2 Tax=Cochliobolus sativus TaxID=45130 RepID=A0A8H5ZPN4_COCSA|nr:uncharacterized protein COCSADRAFT_290026 [Bipolaris sorokiniana ND90Pr]EMD67519.1 hypothetical protein COCSADRAFT_290026 [Bipolaris sorokiniana ND90Pr]KAF5854588.1 hypothetical protein GGP41_007402 [Bipolaris sorokiniana]